MMPGWLRQHLQRLALLVTLFPAAATAQGTDGTPAERDLMVIAALLPAIWDNGEQASFEPRMKVPPSLRHAQSELRVTAIGSARHSASFTASRTGGESETWVLSVADDAVRMTRSVGCAIIWQREAGQFAGQIAPDCTNGQLPERWMLSTDRLWIGVTGLVPVKFARAVSYHCYVDIPGASGGRAVDFKRIDGLELTDQGKIAWFDSPEKPSRKLGLQLRNVDWQINNAPGVYVRDSLTLYLVEATPGGDHKALLYGWTQHGAPRIGINGLWALANCAIEPLGSGKPEF